MKADFPKYCILLLLILVFSLALSACGEESPPTTSTSTPPNPTLTSTPASIETTLAVQTTSPSSPLPQLPRFEKATCLFTPLDSTLVANPNFTCGSLFVPEIHGKQNGKVIRLHLAIVKSNAKNAQPLVILQGGPGSSVQNLINPLSVSKYSTNFYFKNYDLIFLDQRGTIYSYPSLRCYESEIEDLSLFDQVLSRQEQLAQSTKKLDLCLDRLKTQNTNFDAYNTVESAGDINDLRTALGYDKINLYGVSYGTRVALTTMRDYPQILRSVVLDSPVPLEADSIADDLLTFDRALKLLFQKCEKDKSCNKAFPDLKTTFSSAAAKLSAQPPTLQLKRPGGKGVYQAKGTKDRFILTVIESLYSRSQVIKLPQLISQIDKGDYTLWEELLAPLLFNGSSYSRGDYYSVMCREEAGFTQTSKLAENSTKISPEISNYLEPQQQNVLDECNKWPVQKAADKENEAVKSEVPTLVLSGELDPITPPEYARNIAKNLTNVFLVEFLNEAHGTLFEGSCSALVMNDFLRNPIIEPTDGCKNSETLTFRT